MLASSFKRTAPVVSSALTSSSRRLTTVSRFAAPAVVSARAVAVRSTPVFAAPFSRTFASSSSSSSSHEASAAPTTFLPENEVRDRVLAVVKQFPKVDALKVQPGSNFITDLGLDSLDTVELVMIIEEEFVITIPDDVAEKILTCEDAVKFISAHPMAR